MDCSKNFTKSTARSHNSCISEAEKYEKTLFRGGSGSKSKKVDPQEVWTMQIATAAAKATKYKELMTRLLSYGNVPRKAPKFINFARNSLGVRDNAG